MYYANELKETVVYGVPTEEMGKDKWKSDIEPVFHSSKYKANLPRSGQGSKGGVGDSLALANGATIKFMSGRGGDEKRSGFTSRVIVVTECDKMDDVRESSDETNPIQQIIARANAFKWYQKRIFLECTVSHTNGFIWQAYLHGTESKLFHRCPICGEFVHFERENLKGWQGCDNEIEAYNKAYWECPKCKGKLNDQQRRTSCKYANTRLVHKGQEVDREGVIHGDLPETRTLGFRWNAYENLLLDTGEYGAKEFKAAVSEDIISSERELKQFVWATPCDPDVESMRSLSSVALRERTSEQLPKGVCPQNTLFITAGIDIGAHDCWAVYTAWSPGVDNNPYHLRGNIISYENWRLDHELYTKDEAGSRAILAALENYVGYHEGNCFRTTDGREIPIMLAGIDSGYETKTIYEFCRERRCETIVPVKGYGQSINAPKYNSPSKTTRGNEIVYIGNGFHVKIMRHAAVFLFETDADYWKSQVHDRLGVNRDNSQSLLLYGTPDKSEHNRFINHLTAEEQVYELTPTGGRMVWRKKAGVRSNHYLDALAYACMIGSYCNERRILEQQQQSIPNDDEKIIHKLFTR